MDQTLKKSSSGDFCDCPHVQRHVTLKCMVMSSQGNQAFNVLREQVDRRKLSIIVHNSHQKTSAILGAFFNIFRNAETTICKCYCVIIECSMAWWGPHKVTLYTASLGTYKRIFMVDAQPSLLASLMKKWGVSSHICDFTKFKNQYFTKKKKN